VTNQERDVYTYVVHVGL